MSTVAPPRARALLPAPLRMRRFSFGKAKEVSIPEKTDDEQPTIPVKSPKRLAFAPLATSRSKEGDADETKTLPTLSTPTTTDHTSPIDNTSLPLENSKTSIATPPLVSRTNTRLSAASTAVNSPNSLDSSTSPALPRPAVTTGPTPPPTTPPSARRRSSTSSFNSPTTRRRSSLTRPSLEKATSPSKPPLSSSRYRPAQDVVVPPSAAGKTTPGQKVKEGAFFALVLLPLSCWYTRGGKRLKELDMRELEEENARRKIAGDVADADDEFWRGREAEKVYHQRGRSVDETRSRSVRPGTREGPPSRRSVDRSRPPTRGLDVRVPRMSVDDGRGEMGRVVNAGK